MRKVAAAAVMLATLAALLAWQWSREARISACTASGGIWNGPQTRCMPGPARPILKRDIERS